MDTLVGLSLILIGYLGYRESSTADAGMISPSDPQQKLSGTATLLNGLLHGFSWDGAPSLAPSLVAPNIYHCLAYLVSYSFGVALSMSMATFLASAGTRYWGKKYGEGVAGRVGRWSSVLAVVVGAVWVIAALGGK